MGAHQSLRAQLLAARGEVIALLLQFDAALGLGSDLLGENLRGSRVIRVRVTAGLGLGRWLGLWLGVGLGLWLGFGSARRAPGGTGAVLGLQ